MITPIHLEILQNTVRSRPPNKHSLRCSSSRPPAKCVSQLILHNLCPFAISDKMWTRGAIISNPVRTPTQAEEKTMYRKPVWCSTATMQSWTAKPANEWQRPVKFILARGGPCWLLTKVCGWNPRQHNTVLPPESQQLSKCSLVRKLVLVILDWMWPLSSGAVKALYGSHLTGQSGLSELIVYFF